MARADLLIRLVKSGMQGDKITSRKVAEAIIAEERAKQHLVLADQLENILKNQPIDRNGINSKASLDPRIDHFVHEIIPKKELTDLVLSSEISQICQEFIQEYHRCDLLRSYNLEPRHRLLFIGPPGNGKTSLAEAIATALMVPLMVVRYENIIGTYLGETSSRLGKLFEFASARKCVLFFDEFETLGKERGDIHETGEIKRVVSSLLLQIDSLPSHVVVIGATNHAELLDRAAWRRFQIRMYLPIPTLSFLKQWFGKFEHKIQIPLGYSPDILAKHLLNSSFAEVEEFGVTVLRQFVLNLPNANMKNIVSQTLDQWSVRTVNVKQIVNAESTNV